MEKMIEFANVSKLQAFSEAYSEIQESYLFSHIRTGSTEGLVELIGREPIKLGGQLLLLVLESTPFEIRVNQETYTLEANTMLSASPNSYLELGDDVPTDVEAYLMYFDFRFMQSLNLRLNSLGLPPINERPKPVWHLKSDELEVVVKYFELMHANAGIMGNQQLSRSIASSLIAAMVYQIIYFYYKNQVAELARSYGSNEPGTGRKEYVRQFVHLVQMYYTKERAVAFYADKLFITPKYLSMLVREATGRSAAKWIDDFVLMEAKNMLRYSGKNIQQVAYALNFPTQSSFGKYFKHLTGMSPSEYQKL